MIASAVVRDFRRTWPQLVLTDLLSRALAVVAIAPLVGLLLKLFLARVPDGVLKDEQIPLFLLSPAGIAALLVVGAVSLGVLFAEQGVLMVIAFAAAGGRHATYLDAIRYVAGRLRRLVSLGGNVLLRVILLAAPFLAGIGGVYLLLLRAHDINFYLSRRPPELWTAVVLGSLLVTPLAILLLYRIAAWIVAIPVVLFESGSSRDALKASERATEDRRGRIAWGLVGWVATVFFLSWSVSWLLGGVGRWLLPREAGSLILLAVSLATVILLSALWTFSVSVLATCLFPLLVVRLYLGIAGPGELRPPIAAAGTLGERAVLRIPGKPLLAAVMVSLVAVLIGGYFALRAAEAEDHAAIIAHRGASGNAPENTLAAFQRAIDDAADWIELDVQEDADGVVVVAHDSDFMKVAGVGLKVWEATGADLQGIDIGSYFDPAFADQRVPTLGEALELARGKIRVFIELKYYGHDRELEARVVEIVEQAGMAGDIVVMSLKEAGIRKIDRLRPDWTYGLLTTVSVGDLTRLDLDFLALNAKAATPSLIRRAHRRGMKIHVWTVNDPVQMSVMLSRGVDGLITDEPALARQVMDLREELSPLGRLVVWAAGEAGLLRGAMESSAAEDA